MTKIADDSTSIAARLKEIEQERVKQIMGVPIEEPVAVEAPKDLDWTGVYGAYGSPSGLSSGIYMGKTGDSPVSDEVVQCLRAAFDLPDLRRRLHDVDSDTSAGRLTSMAHPEWPYTGTPHEWRGFVSNGSPNS